MTRLCDERGASVSSAATIPIQSHPLDVFLLVVLGDLHVSATRLEVDRDDLAESLFGRAERVVDDVGDIVFPTMKLEIGEQSPLTDSPDSLLTASR